MTTNNPDELHRDTVTDPPDCAVHLNDPIKRPGGNNPLSGPDSTAARAPARGRRARAPMLVLTGTLIAAVALAACGGGSTSSSSGSTSTTPSSTTAAAGAAGSGSLAAFRSCMTGQGITLPQRSGTSSGTPPSTTPGATRPAGGAGGASRFNTPPPGVNAATYQAALNACRSKLPTGGSGASSSALQVYRSCLGDHGVTLPASGGLSSLNQTDPNVVAAMNACKALVPAGGLGGGSSTTTTTIAGA
jgi:hypothetical protein